MGTLSLLNAIIVVSTLMLVTLLGHRLARSSTNATEFFTAGGGLPWWAVAASLYATVLSAVSFVSIPATVFREGGNLTFVQIVIGLALGKIALAFLFVRPYYASSAAETVYDYLSLRLGRRVSIGVMILQTAFIVANNSIVVLSAALVLNVITDISVSSSCVVIVCFAILWSWMGGLRTVVWTDAALFGIFIIGAVLSAVLTYASTGLSPVEALTELDQSLKLKLFDLSLDPSRSYTLWTGLITGTLLGMAVIGSQSSLQRIRACRSASAAQLAFSTSAALYVTPLLLLLVGLGLSLFYGVHGVPPDLATRVATQPDQVFPYFIVHEIPDGVSGVFVAAIFAAAISTLDSRLTELSDVCVTNIYRHHIKKNASEKHYIRAARLFLLGWGLIYCLSSVALSLIDGRNLLDLTWQVSNTFAGPILGTFLLARFGIGGARSITLGTLMSVAITVYLNANGVTHFWWFPASMTIMFVTGWAASRRPLDPSGVVWSEKSLAKPTTNDR